MRRRDNIPLQLQNATAKEQVCCLGGASTLEHSVLFHHHEFSFKRDRASEISRDSPLPVSRCRNVKQQPAPVLILEACCHCYFIEQTCNASSPPAEACLPLLWSAVEEQTKGRPQIQMRVL